MTPTATLHEPPVVVVPIEVAPVEHHSVIDRFADSVSRGITAARVRMAKLWAWIKLKARNGWNRVTRAARWTRTKARNGWGWTKGKASQAWTWIKAKVTKLASWVGETSKTVWTQVKKHAKGFWGWLKSKLSTAWEWVKTTSVKVWNWTCSKARATWDWLVAKAPAVGSVLMNTWGWIGGHVAKLSMAARIGISFGSSVAAAIVASPFFVLAAAAIITTMILSAPRSKPVVIVKPSEEDRIRLHARLAELAPLLDDANQAESYKLSSELLGRQMFLEAKLDGVIGNETPHAIATGLKKRCQEKLHLDTSDLGKAIAKTVHWPEFIKGVKSEIAMWAEPQLHPAMSSLTPVAN